MFNPNEEIQIIGIDLGDNPDWQSQYIANEVFIKSKGDAHYKEKCKENIKLQQELLKYKLKELEEIK